MADGPTRREIVKSGDDDGPTTCDSGHTYFSVDECPICSHIASIPKTLRMARD